MKQTHRTREQATSYRVSHSNLTEKDLARLTRELTRTFHPQLIVLFGSRAYGKPRADSDLDVLVVTTNKKPSPLITSSLSLDVHTRTPDELTRQLAMGDAFTQEIIQRGKRLYPKRAQIGFLRQVQNALERGRTQPMDNSELVQEWVQKAEEDFEGAQTILRRRRKFLPNLLCWTCEQSVEKYLKAFLTRQRVKFERTHHLETLYQACLNVDSDFRLIQQSVDAVLLCVPQIRYPGHSVTEEQARAAFAASKPIRKFVRAKLALRG
ncbi:MAG TPA: HEPN domain-containing protein [Anaerolineae bacterium]|nr:HEPN domain-containing protein [Anaerolineae bacterium]